MAARVVVVAVWEAVVVAARVVVVVLEVVVVAARVVVVVEWTSGLTTCKS